MKIKNTLNRILLLASIMLLVFPAGLVLAQEEETLAANLISPNAGILYRLDVYFDNQRLLRAKDGIEKARVALEIANERAAEIKAVENEPALVAEADSNREIALSVVTSQRDKLNMQDKNEVETNIARHIEVLKLVRTRIATDTNVNNDNSLKALDAAIGRSTARLTEVKNIIPMELRENNEAVKELVVLGEGCYSDSECESGKCRANFGTKPTCVTNRAISEVATRRVN